MLADILDISKYHQISPSLGDPQAGSSQFSRKVTEAHANLKTLEPNFDLIPLVSQLSFHRYRCQTKSLQVHLALASALSPCEK